MEYLGFMYAALENFKQSSRCCGSGISLSLMGAQEQFHLKIEVIWSETTPVFKAYAQSNRQDERARQCTTRGQRNTTLIIRE